MPTLTANRLAQWALTLSQYDYTIKYRKAVHHDNAEALSFLSADDNTKFDEEEQEADVSAVCTIRVISQQLNHTDPGLLAKESSKDPVISTVMRYVKVQCPHTPDSRDVFHYKKLEDSLIMENGCLLFGV